MVEGMVLVVPNRHIPDCGVAPNLNSRKFQYCSYFENIHGEQLVVVLEGHTVWLYHGDWGWENRQKVVDGHVPDMILDKQERDWLSVCWSIIATRLTYLAGKQ